MFDVFYSGTKPNLFAHEQAVDTIEQAQQQSRTRFFWFVNYLCDYTDFDFLWEPVPWQSHQRHAWPSQWQKSSGTYLVPKQDYTETYYRTETPVPRIRKIENVWVVPDGADVSTFDWTWHPDDTEPPYIYQFGTQHQRTGGPQCCISNATDTKYVDQIKIKTRKVATAVYEIDHMDGNAGRIPNTTRIFRYFDNYLDTLRRLAKNIPLGHEHVWICSSVCDYSNFDFSWHPEVWQDTMLHVFASDGNKFGDTFYMHVPTFQHRVDQIELLDWYALNFIETSVPRRPLPVIRHHSDSQVDAVKNQSWSGPLAIFAAHNHPIGPIPCVPLWQEKTKTIVPLDIGATTVVVPKNAVPSIKTQLYDYTYIDKTKKQHMPSAQQDVIFISYDEPDADQNWEILKNKCSRAQRVHGVAGMELALEAAADISTTPWYYAVFAKTRLHDKFDFSFVPDYMQQPKNYIFNCRNRVNGLEYGHMGIVMYNCQGIKTLNQQGDFGLDYTLSFPHESVPVLSCYGEFDQTPYHTWRTAFRECAKLAYFESQTATVDGAYRLQTWLEKVQGPYAEWCLRGAADGVEFFNSSNQQIQTLKQSFKWEWLRSYFESRYGKLE